MLQQDVNELLRTQLATWPDAANNYNDLDKVKTKELQFPGCRMLATFNPGRIRSSVANIDKQSVQERDCFLCDRNRPPEQRGVTYKGEYKILVNPYPIFHRHLTITSMQHTDQIISPERMSDLLLLTHELSDFTLFYNGPRCGASAPDHFHFQAGERGYMPVETDILENTETWLASPHLTIKTKKDYVRSLIIIQSDHPSTLLKVALETFLLIGETVKREPEPMTNIISFWENDQWNICIFPRKEHRPSQFFEEGDKKIVFSPGAVDFGGVLVIPREEDYNKITPETVEDMFSQLTFSPSDMDRLREKIIKMRL